MLFHRLVIPFDNKLRTFIPYWRQYSSCCRIFQKNNSKITILNQISIMTCGRHMDLHPRFALKPSSRKMLEKALSSRELLEKRLHLGQAKTSQVISGNDNMYSSLRNLWMRHRSVDLAMYFCTLRSLKFFMLLHPLLGSSSKQFVECRLLRCFEWSGES